MNIDNINTRKILFINGWNVKSSYVENSNVISKIANILASQAIYLDIVTNIDNIDIIELNNYDNIQSLFQELSNRYYKHVIGFSLGGQVALRLLENKAIVTDNLILLNTPYSILSLPNMRHAFSCKHFDKIQDEVFQKQNLDFYISLLHRDTLYANQYISIDFLENSYYWLSQLRNFVLDDLVKDIYKSSDILKLENMYILASTKDRIVPYRQSYEILRLYNFAYVFVLQNENHLL